MTNNPFYFDKLQSQTVNLLRFPLMVMIVFIHTDEQGLLSLNPSTFSLGLYTATQIFAKVAMPLFFIISGYYFFTTKEYQQFGKQIYVSKLKNRIKTLLIPYLFWNFFTLVFQMLAFWISGHKDWNDLSLFTSIRFFDIFLGIAPGYSGMPKDFPLWFLRDLMLLCILSPLLYKLLKRKKFYFLILFAALWMLPIANKLPLVLSRLPIALFFFSLGGYFSINKLNIIQTVRKIPYYISITVPMILLIIHLYMSITHNGDISTVQKFFRLTATVPVLQLAAYLTENKRITAPKFVANASFFLFVIHSVIIRFGFIMPFAHIIEQGLLNFWVYYLMQIILTVSLAVLLYYALLKLLPKFTKVVTGGR